MISVMVEEDDMKIVCYRGAQVQLPIRLLIYVSKFPSVIFLVMIELTYEPICYADEARNRCGRMIFLKIPL